MEETRVRNSEHGLGMGMIFGILLVVLLVILFFLFGSNFGFGGTTNTGGENGGTEIQVPDEIDVNINQGEGTPQ